jgi:hypothetical protein
VESPTVEMQKSAHQYASQASIEKNQDKQHIYESTRMLLEQSYGDRKGSLMRERMVPYKLQEL